MGKFGAVSFNIEGFMLDMGLSGTELIIYALIHSYTKYTGLFYASSDYIAALAGISRRTAQRILERLRALGAIEKASDGKHDGFRTTSLRTRICSPRARKIRKKTREYACPCIDNSRQTPSETEQQEPCEKSGVSHPYIESKETSKKSGVSHPYIESKEPCEKSEELSSYIESKELSKKSGVSHPYVESKEISKKSGEHSSYIESKELSKKSGVSHPYVESKEPCEKSGELPSLTEDERIAIERAIERYSESCERELRMFGSANPEKLPTFHTLSFGKGALVSLTARQYLKLCTLADPDVLDGYFLRLEKLINDGAGSGVYPHSHYRTIKKWIERDLGV